MAQNKKEKVYKELRKQIISNEIKPGSPINEEFFSKKFGVSKIPIREALRQLENDSFVENIPGRGTRVTDITIKYIRETFEIRDIIEAGVAKRAAKIECKEKLIKKRKELVRKLSNKKNMDQKKSDQIFDEMHFFIVDIIGNEKLSDLYRILIAKTQRIRNLFIDRLSDNRLEDLTEEHLGILDAIIEGDSKKAERLVDKHLKDSALYLIMRLANYNQ